MFSQSKKNLSKFSLEKLWNDLRAFNLFSIIALFILFFPLGFMPLFDYLNQRRKYLEVKRLRDSYDVKTLLSIIHDNTKNNDAFLLLFCFRALADLQVEEGIRILQDRIKTFNTTNLHTTNGIFFSIHRFYKRWFSDVMDMTFSPFEIVSNESSLPSFIEETLVTKKYFLDKIPTNTKCMITKIPLDFQKDIILVCPYCGNFAKKELFERWLLTKNHCPICKQVLILTDCPLVVLQDFK